MCVSFERIINVPVARHRRQEPRGAPPVVGADGQAVWDAIEAGALGRARGPRARGSGPRCRRLRRPRPAAPTAGRAAGAARAPRRGPRAVGLPRDARRRLGGGRGALGEPARAARGHVALRGPHAGGRPRPAARGDRAGRRPGRLRGRRRRGDAHHAPRREGPGVPGRVHRRASRRGCSRTTVRSTTSRSWRRSGGSRTSGITRAKRRLYPVPRLAARHVGRRRDERPVAVPHRDPARADGRPAARPQGDYGSDLDPDLVFRERRVNRFGTTIRTGGGAYRQGSGRPGSPAARRDLPAVARPRRAARRVRRRRPVGLARSPSTSRATRVGDPRPPTPRPGSRHAIPPLRPPIIPGERRYRDGDRIRHVRWGDGIVVTSKLTRDDEEVTVGFQDPQVGPQDDAREPREPRAGRASQLPGGAGLASSERDDLVEAARPGVRERRDAVAVGEVRIGARVEQHPDDLLGGQGRRRTG